MKVCTVYYLHSSADPTPRYVGQTRQSIIARLHYHMLSAKELAPAPVYCWVRQELEAGNTIKIVAIDQGAEWDVTERVAIWEYRKRYPGLLNVLDGGDDTPRDLRKRLSRPQRPEPAHVLPPKPKHDRPPPVKPKNDPKVPKSVKRERHMKRAEAHDRGRQEWEALQARKAAEASRIARSSP